MYICQHIASLDAFQRPVRIGETSPSFLGPVPPLFPVELLPSSSRDGVAVPRVTKR